MITNRIFRHGAFQPCRASVVAAVVSLLLMSSWCPAVGWGRAVNAIVDGGKDTVEVDSAGGDILISEPDRLWPLDVQSRLEMLLESSIFETSTVGMMVYDLTADSVIFRHNERQLMRPASTLKMMVAVAALDRLGKDYKYETSLLYTGDVDGNTLDGDLFCKGGFDPMFDSGDLDVFVDSVRSLGVDTISGDIYADVSMKDDDRLGEGWCWDDDNPVLSPLLLSREDDFCERLRSRLDADDEAERQPVCRVCVLQSGRIGRLVSTGHGENGAQRDERPYRAARLQAVKVLHSRRQRTVALQLRVARIGGGVPQIRLQA